MLQQSPIHKYTLVPESAYRQITSPIRLAGIRREIEQEQRQRAALADVETTRLQTSGSMRKLPRVTRPMLPLDREGRSYSMIASSALDTMSLIEASIRAFASVEGSYPTVILLSPLRFLAKRGQITHYILPHFNLRIPILFDRSSYEIYAYEVMCRGN